MKAILLIILLAITAGCADNPPKNIRFVLPEDFKGWFAIVEDRKNGLPVRREGHDVKLEIPQTRVLRIQDASFLNDWSAWSCSRASGKDVPIITGEVDETEEFGMRAVILDKAESIYIIGTGPERRRLLMNSEKSLDAVRKEIAKSSDSLK